MANNSELLIQSGIFQEERGGTLTISDDSVTRSATRTSWEFSNKMTIWRWGKDDLVCFAQELAPLHLIHFWLILNLEGAKKMLFHHLLITLFASTCRSPVQHSASHSFGASEWKSSIGGGAWLSGVKADFIAAYPKSSKFHECLLSKFFPLECIEFKIKLSS